MKNFVWGVVFVFSIILFGGCSQAKISSNEIVRIHIRANSNASCDQEVKYLIRDNVVEYITPLIKNCSNSNDVKVVLNNNLETIENIARDNLIASGFDYGVDASICRETFPTRQYDGVVFPSGEYDALILNLGSGKGDNWWCVAYPPLCFVGEDLGTDKVQYRSKVVELIKKYFGGNR